MPRKVMVAGVALHREVDFLKLATDQLQGVGPWNDRNQMESVDGLGAALDDAGPLRRRLASAILELMAHPDPVLRTGAVSLARPVAEILGVDGLVELLDSHPDRYFGVPPQGFTVGRPDLAWPLVLAIGALAPAAHPGATRLLCEVAQREGGDLIIDDLARLDPDWVVAHPELVPEPRLRWVLEQLSGPQRRTLLEAKARALLQGLTQPWTRVDLRPREEDYARVFTPEVSEAARGAYTDLFEHIQPRPLPGRGQTEVQLSLATTEELPDAPGFPGGYRQVRPLLQPGLTWVSWRFLAPGAQAGTSYTGLVWVEDHWSWFPKPWRNLPRP